MGVVSGPSKVVTCAQHLSRQVQDVILSVSRAAVALAREVSEDERDACSLPDARQLWHGSSPLT